MKVKIKGWNTFYNSNHEYHEPWQVWTSPDCQYVVLELWTFRLYVFGKIIKEDGQITTVQYIDSVSGNFIDAESDIKTMSVDWDMMSYGFCKLCCYEIDFNQTKTKRLYYDPELYKRKYQELHGVPYQGEKQFKNGYQP